MAKIAANENEFLNSLFTAGGTYDGFVRKVTKTRVDFFMMGKEFTVNRNAVLCTRTTASDGKTWFSYTSDSDIPASLHGYMDQIKWCEAMLEQYGIQRKYS